MIGKPDAIVHDLRRSGAKHLINVGIDPHTVMAFTGHKTPSMLRRYHIIDVDDLRRAAERAAAFTGRSDRGEIRVLSENSDTSRTPEGVSAVAPLTASR